jgi:hypothetical protein
MANQKYGIVMMRVGRCMDRLNARKSAAEKSLGIRLTWVQFFDTLLNSLERFEAKKK